VTHDHEQPGRLTDEEQLGEAQDRFGLTEEQARLLAAKEGMIRAVEEEAPNRLVLGEILGPLRG
jgi:hypothetical protein